MLIPSLLDIRVNEDGAGLSITLGLNDDNVITTPIIAKNDIAIIKNVFAEFFIVFVLI